MWIWKCEIVFKGQVEPAEHAFCANRPGDRLACLFICISQQENVRQNKYLRNEMPVTLKIEI